MERREIYVLGRFKEPFYSKVHLINENTLRLITLFKLNDTQFLGDDKSGFYLTRE